MERIPGSFRDPSGAVYTDGKKIIRLIFKCAKKDWLQFQESGLYYYLQEKKYLQSTRQISLINYNRESGDDIIDTVEHEKIPFISYPYEWSFNMLRDAALLHLELLDICLQKGFITKDGTSYNIQFVGSQPIYIDPLSIVPYQKGHPWVGFSQFSQLFLFPLFISAYKNIPFQPLLRSELEGINVLTTRKYFSFSDILKPGIFINVFLQAILQKKFSNSEDSLKQKIYSERIIDGKILRSHLTKLKKNIESLPPADPYSPWNTYEAENSYPDKDREAKHHFVCKAVQTIHPVFLLDLGSNTGEYSILTAPHTSYTVAIDSDYRSIDTLYNRLKNTQIRNVLPLIVDIANPSPSLGWKSVERSSFLNRAHPDMVLCLALIHHMVISNNIPLRDFVEWLVQFAPHIVLEFITKNDSWVKKLLKNKEDVYKDFTIECLENILKERCKIKETLVLPSGTRLLYFLERT